jgi:hypothetical protein
MKEDDSVIRVNKQHHSLLATGKNQENPLVPHTELIPRGGFTDNSSLV